jgi:hypothetical protein
VVFGRNGSGKSSFAEALEVLLTGQLRRWEKLPAVWRHVWRSMHHPQQAQITAEFLVEGAGVAVAQRIWPDGADVATSSVYAQFRGEKRAGLEQLAWSAALADHRPFLAHGEIEAFFGSPSGLYELLASVLGLEDLNAAGTGLRHARLSRGVSVQGSKQEPAGPADPPRGYGRRAGGNLPGGAQRADP